MKTSSTYLIFCLLTVCTVNRVSSNCMETETTPDVSGSITYLSRHNVTCQSPNTILSKFRLNSHNYTKISYSYGCCDLASSVSCETKKTRSLFIYPPSLANKNLQGLSVNCPDGKALSSFQLKRDAIKLVEIYYEYTCCPISSGNCETMQTPAEDDGSDYKGPQVIYLDRHDVDCQGAALQSFELVEKPSKQISYSYTCCQVKTAVGKTEDEPASSPIDDACSTPSYLNGLLCEMNANSARGSVYLFEDGKCTRRNYYCSRKPSHDLFFDTMEECTRKCEKTTTTKP